MTFPVNLFHGKSLTHGPYGGLDTNTLLCYHCDGTNGSTTFTDVSSFARGNATVSGSASVSTAQSQFGGASCRVANTNDWIGSSSTGVAAFSGGNFTIEMWLRFNTVPGQFSIVSDVTNGEGTIDVEYVGGTGTRVQFNAGSLFTYAWTASTATWYHWALVSTAGNVNVYINGVPGTGQAITPPTLDKGIQFGQRATGGEQMDGWIDEIRVSNVARYSTNFSGALPGSAFT